MTDMDLYESNKVSESEQKEIDTYEKKINFISNIIDKVEEISFLIDQYEMQNEDTANLIIVMNKLGDAEEALYAYYRSLKSKTRDIEESNLWI